MASEKSATLWRFPILRAALVVLVGMSAYASPPSAIYEIYPRSFQDSDGDGIGDLGGIKSRLDYLQDLGIDTVWLMPVYPSPSVHGYDVTDYESIAPLYGGTAGLTSLLAAARVRGLKILLDIPVNSTSTQHPWFISSTRPDSADHDLYIWSPIPLNWTAIEVGPGESPTDKWHKVGAEYFFSIFSGEMPDLNWKSADVYDKVSHAFKLWSKLGVDGFRLDAAKHLVKGPNGEQNQPGTHFIWQRIARELKEINPDNYLVGEVWDSEQTIASYYGTGLAQGKELSAAFDFPVMSAIRDSLKARNAASIAEALKTRLRVLATQDFALPFLGNHDTVRLASDVPKQQLKNAALIALTLPGSPVIYYGDEIGLQSGTGDQYEGDLAKRAPMQWDQSIGQGFTRPGVTPWLPPADGQTSVAMQTLDPQSLLSEYKSLLKLRRSLQALNGKSLADPEMPKPNVLSYWRLAESGPSALVIVNLGAKPSGPFKVPLPVSIGLDSRAQMIYGEVLGDVIVGDHGILISGLAAYSGAVIGIR